MKKTQLLFIFLILSVIVVSCTKQAQEPVKPADQNTQTSIDSVNAITGGISEVDNVNSDVSVTDVDADIVSLDTELKNW